MTNIESLVKEIMLSGRVISITGPDGSEVVKFKGSTKAEAVTLLLEELENYYIRRHLDSQKDDK